jgi:hypothetical protein
MAAMFVVLLVGIIVIQALDSIIPSLTNILMIVLILFVSYFIYNYYSELNSRSLSNYDELELGDSTQDKGSSSSNNNNGDLIGSPLGYCIGSNCCSAGQAWSEKLGQCIPTCTTGTCYNLAAKGCASASSPSVCDGFSEMGPFATAGQEFMDPAKVLLMSNADLGYKPFDKKSDSISAF